jgi:ABC-type transport system involved in multi-copper enzyme maturation permease subunit
VTTAPGGTPATLDVSGTPGIPFLRLLNVELRKSADTRAGRWLIAVTFGITLVADVIIAIVLGVKDEHLQYGDLVAGAAFGSSILLPVLGIMLVTSEWSQRTAMTTFALEPRRMRIVLAKMLAGVALTAFVIAFALVVGLLCNFLYAAFGGTLDWTFGWTGFFGFLATQTMAMLGGFALACLVLNTPAAIVIFFVYKWVLPGLLALGAALMAWFNDLVDWIDFQSAQNLLYDGGLSGSDWAHLVVSGFIWLVVPLVIGLWRIQRAEVK